MREDRTVCLGVKCDAVVRAKYSNSIGRANVIVCTDRLIQGIVAFFVALTLAARFVRVHHIFQQVLRTSTDHVLTRSHRLEILEHILRVKELGVNTFEVLELLADDEDFGRHITRRRWLSRFNVFEQLVKYPH